MGNRSRLAALGVTCSLLVAACATSNSPLANSPELSLAPKPEAPATSSGTAIGFPDALADASFIRPDTSGDTCRAEHPAQISLLSTSTGEPLWSFPTPQPGQVSVADDARAFVSFRSDRGQAPGLGAIDLTTRGPAWQRFFETEVQDLELTTHGLIVVTRDAIRSVAPASGDDLWVNDSQFDFDNVILTPDVAYALDRVGVKAIDLSSGRVVWTLDDVDSGDTISLTDNTLAVAARTRIVAVDLAARGRLWDIEDADRLGAGELWATPKAIFYEVSPNVAPGGGVTALDRRTGNELWTATNVGTPAFVGSGQLVTSTASSDQPPAEPFVFVGLDAATGQELWRLSSTTQVFDGVVATSDGKVIISDPHPAAPGFFRVRLIDSLTGKVTWQSQSAHRHDGAQFGVGDFVSLYGTEEISTGNTGNVALIVGNQTQWTTELTGGVAQPPQLTSDGLLVISPSQFSCIARMVVDPTPTIGSEVLGATTERSANG